MKAYTEAYTQALLQESPLTQASIHRHYGYRPSPIHVYAHTHLAHTMHKCEADKISDGENENIVDIKESCKTTPTEQQMVNDTQNPQYNPKTQLGNKLCT